MDDCLTNLARRLVAAPRWRWMPGMLATGEGWLGEARIVEVDDDGTPLLWMYRGYSRGPATAHALGDRVDWSDSHSEPIPDLTDPATVGCLRALVGEAWGSDHDVSRFATHTERGVEIWYRLERLDLNGWNSLVTVPVMSGETRFIGGATPAEALVDALLHAPVQP